MTDYQIQRLGSTTFALRPDYDAVVAQLGGEPPTGVPVECTFEWAWDLAEQTVARQNRQAATKARLAAKAANPVAEKAAPPRKTAPRKAAPRKRGATPK